ncbi:MAG: phage/plasmid primase, P4 family [Elusimicrobia bacterium]|nr:phage/plasmid primase, P4 family [Elusimicrobiota bacterium]
MSKLKWALSLAEQGWPVFPLEPNGKKPITRNGFKDATTSAEAIQQWWERNPDANIGLATGVVSGIAAVDIDVKKGAKGRESAAGLNGGLPPTLKVLTPSGGWHLYYVCPEGGLRSRNGLLPGVDLKADGGYVVAPGSTIDGKAYEWNNAEEHLSAMSEEILALTRKPVQPPSLTGALRDGTRNSTLASIAGTMRRRGMSAGEIKAALAAINMQRCDPPLPDKEVNDIAASISRYPPAARDDEDEPVPPGFTDDALALKFTSKYADDWRYVAPWGHWLHWDGARWLRETTLKAFDLSRRVCREASASCEKANIAAKVASASTVAAVERLARADRKHAAGMDIWDRDQWQLNAFGAGTDLRTGELKPHARADYMTKIAAATPQGDAPTWLRFLADITGGDEELQRYLARMAGYALTGVTTEHALFFLYGTGANGKSVFLNTLSAVMGDYAVSAPIDTFLENKNEKHPTDLAGLRGARLVTSIEVEKGKRWAESKIKSLTGGDKIAARFMRQDFFEYKPQFKLIIAGNNKPAIRDVDEAMRRRLHLVPFTVTIPPEKRDQTLSDRLLAEGDGILRWMLDGCLEWQKTGLKPPTSVVSATEEYLESEDALGRWIDDECVRDINAEAVTDDLFASWKVWTEKCGEYAGTKRRFSDDLDKRGFIRRRSGRKGNRAFQGIGLKGKEVQGTIL